jgi:isoleucyl-tRNA synthetase
MDETQICQFWKDEKIFEKQNEINKDKSGNNTFHFFDGPPFMTGSPHYGHILAGFIKDSITRHQHSKGFYVPRVSGIDVHGLPIEYEIEKKLGIKTTQQVLEFGIGNYNKECENIVLSCKDQWKEIMTRLGRWVDFDNGYTTMSKEFMNSVWWVFSELYKKDRVYEGVKIMPYSTSCGTPLSNFETQQNYKEINDDSLYFKINIIDDDNILKAIEIYNLKILVWTTTPWTLASNYLLAINKNFTYLIVTLDDNKNEQVLIEENLILEVLKNKKYEINSSVTGEFLLKLKYEPLFTFNSLHNNYKIVHGDFVTNNAGTGIVHISPSFGNDDYELCLKENIIKKDTKLFIPLDINGYITNDIPDAKGLFYKNFNNKKNLDFNTWIIIELKKKNLYHEKKTIKHNYPFCWRSDTPLIYRAVSSHFIKVEDMREKLVNLNKEINWFPKNVGDNRFASWIGNTRDWCVSRNRFWGTPLPIWKSDDGNEICISSSYELEKLLNMEENTINNLHRDHIDNLIIIKDGKEYKRVSATLDCWFESGSMPYGSLGNKGIVNILRNSDTGIQYDNKQNPFIRTKDDFIHKILPADFIAEGLDQTRGWFYTLLVLSASLFNMIPFKNVIVNGIILADNGEKMSKRLQNYPDPIKVIEKYSSDCLRLYLLGSQVSAAESLKFNENGVLNAMKDIVIKIKSGCLQFFKEYTKLYYEKTNKRPLINILHNDNYKKIKNPINLWFLLKYKKYRDDYFEYMNNYNLRNAVGLLYKLIEDLNNGYIKIGRYLFKGNDGSKTSNDNCIESLSTLYFVFRFLSNDFKAIIPFLSETINLELNNISKLYSYEAKDELDEESIHLYQYGEYPNLNETQIELANDFDIIYELIKSIYKLRSKNNKNAKKPIKNIYLMTNELISNRIKEEYYDYISEECNILNISKIDETTVNIKKNLSPVKSFFFKKYGKEIKDTFDELINKNSEELEQILNEGQYNGFEITIDDFNINYEIKFNDNSVMNEKEKEKEIKMEETIINNHKIFIIADMTFDEDIDKLYYGRLFSTSVQRMRKEADLHPWNKINVYWKGEPKYTFDEEMINNINKIVKMDILKYNEEIKEKIFFEKQCQKTNLIICFEKI